MSSPKRPHFFTILVLWTLITLPVLMLKYSSWCYPDPNTQPCLGYCALAAPNVPVSGQLVSPLCCLLPGPPSLANVGQLSPSISWKCDGWQVEGERTGLLRGRQTHSKYPLVFHLAQRWAGHADHTHTLEFPGQWWISNLPAEGWTRCLRSQGRERPPCFISLSF